ncbi:DUF2306 domain-containing protein [uncultured Tenacibaculum sp.]|uniref:DUF2306 domain-containing protein n=1 Tax=uncultured Tenacibaculum sp. TaxID=174713 RepID=UPI0026161F08|nr:DUF2306 domain-containing protein [uncultured Tenacibaculum sp.]
MKRLLWLIFICLCLFIGITRPLKYFLADGPIDLLAMKPQEVLDSIIYKISFFVHITFGGIALLIGWIQFSEKIRKKYIKLHRIIGKIYVGSIFIAGPVGFYIGFFARGGLPTEIGFTFGALIWIVATYMGYKTIRKGNIEAHKEYMTYSYAGTFAAVTLRFWLPLLISTTRNFDLSYGISVWLSWIPNIFVAYLIVHKKDTVLYYYKKYKIKTILKGSAAIAVVMVILSYTSIQTWFYKKPSFKGIALEKKTINQDSYFTTEKFNEIDNYLKEESETTSMMVLENGKVVYEYGDVSEISDIKDSRNGIVSLLFGKYVENNTINLQETIEANNVSEYNGLLPMEKQASIENLLTSSSGVIYPKNQRYFYTFPRVRKRGMVKPGDYFMVNNWDYNVTSYILENKSKNHFHREVENQLAIPLGFEDWNIENQYQTRDLKKSMFTSYQIHISTRDMAKIGQLLLQEGKWNEKQIVPKNWVNKITSTFISRDSVTNRVGRDISSPMQQSYGYSWWLFERFYDNPDFENAYTSWDESGQFITVIPKRNVVIAHKTKLDYLTHTKLSERTKTPSWRYWWIIRKLMLNRKLIAELSPEKSADEIIEFIKSEYNTDSEYAISERLINEYGQSLADKGNYIDAIKFFELNLKLYPNHGYYTHRIYNYYGNSLVKLKRNEEALKAFEESLKLNSDNPEAKKMIEQLKP